MYTGPNIVRDGLKIWWDFASTKCYSGDGTTVYDLSGNGNDGTISESDTSGVVYYPDIKHGALHFNRSYTPVVYTPYVLNTGDDWTVEVTAMNDYLVYNSISTVYRHTLWAYVGDLLKYSFYTYTAEIWSTTANELDQYVSFNGSGSSYTNLAGTNYTQEGMYSNKWHVYTISNSGGVNRFYKDGRFMFSDSMTYYDNVIYFKIGNRNLGITGSVSNAWNGYISSAKVYDRTLTSGEVRQSSNAILKRFL